MIYINGIKKKEYTVPTNKYILRIISWTSSLWKG